MLHAKAWKTTIADALGRDRETLHRKTKRNVWPDDEVPEAEGSWQMTSQMLADQSYCEAQKARSGPRTAGDCE